MPYMNRRTKRLAAIHRGLEKKYKHLHHPSEESSPNQKFLAKILKLEYKQNISDAIISSCNEIAFDLLKLVDEEEFDRISLKDAVIDLLICINGENS